MKQTLSHVKLPKLQPWLIAIDLEQQGLVVTPLAVDLLDTIEETNLRSRNFVCMTSNELGLSRVMQIGKVWSRASSELYGLCLPQHVHGLALYVESNSDFIKPGSPCFVLMTVPIFTEEANDVTLDKFPSYLFTIGKSTSTEQIIVDAVSYSSYIDTNQPIIVIASF